MKSVKVAETAGFCFGVQRAVSTAYKMADETDGAIYTLGPIIHNEQVVGDLEKKRVHVLEEKDIDQLPDGAMVIIRSHGITEELCDHLKKKGLNIIDMTCPFVKKIHNLVQENTLKGRYVIIIGNPIHPEVVGIKGWAKGPCSVISSEEDFTKLELSKEIPVTIVAQTTFNYEYFQDLVEKIRGLGYDVNVMNTICNATRDRQTEAAKLAAEVDVMLVVGSRSSSNTQKLYDICKAKCADTYYIQATDDLVTVQLNSESRVGITAGASAPNTIIQEVSEYVRGTKF